MISSTITLLLIVTTYISFLMKTETFYKRREDTWCSDDIDAIYSTKREAENICDQMQQQYKNCTTIYDRGCDGYNYMLCEERATILTSSKGSCTHFRLGNAIHTIFF